MQLVLPVTFRKQDGFETFIEGENAQLVCHIKSLLTGDNQFPNASQRLSVLQGPSGSGKTHLLLGSCEFADTCGLSHQYFDLHSLKDMPPEMLLGLLNKDVICIDNLDEVDNLSGWQRAIFDAINQFVENESRLLLIATKMPINKMNYTLPDLKTRLTWGTNFSVNTLSDTGKMKALRLHMNALGIAFTDDAITFLLKRCSRDMHQLISTLDTLDKASLQNQRKVTIPFIKTVLHL